MIRRTLSTFLAWSFGVFLWAVLGYAAVAMVAGCATECEHVAQLAACRAELATEKRRVENLQLWWALREDSLEAELGNPPSALPRIEGRAVVSP